MRELDEEAEREKLKSSSDIIPTRLKPMPVEIEASEELKREKKQALKDEAIAAKREHRAKMELANSDSQEEALQAKAKIAEAKEQKRIAKLRLKESEIAEEKEAEHRVLEADDAT